MLAAATALGDSWTNYRRLFRFMTMLGVTLTCVHILIGITPLFDLILHNVLRVPQEIIEHSRIPFILMAPTTVAVGYRRLWQGLLIRYNRTRIIPLTMLSRVAVIIIVLIIGFTAKIYSGALIATAAMSIGMIVSAITAGFFFRVSVAKKIPENAHHGYVMKWPRLLAFYVPLSLTSIFLVVSRPIQTFGMSRALFPVNSLAVWPVISAFLFLFNSLALSYQEAVIALLERNPDYKEKLKVFARGLALILSIFTLLVGATQLRILWFKGVNGLSDDLFSMVRIPVLILAAMPALITLKSWMRAQYVRNRRTAVLTQGIALYAVALLLFVLVSPRFFAVSGVLMVSIGFVLAQALENGFLLLRKPGKQDKNR